VDLNRVLIDAGLLRLDRPARDEWDAGVISAESRAFALDPGRIYLHRRSRFARGTVAEADVPALKREVRELLLGLTCPGDAQELAQGLTCAPQRVMNRVLDGQEVYEGAPDAPDLICVPEPGLDLKAKFDRTTVFGHYGRHGMHRPEDAFFYDTHGGEPQRLRDVGALVLDHFGIQNSTGGILL